jgi:hypothetical protein
MQRPDTTPSFELPDRSIINIEQEQERRYWTGRLGVTRDVLRRAVSRVGAQPEKVEAYLRGTH